MNFRNAIGKAGETIRNPRTWEKVAKGAGIVAAGATLAGQVVEHFGANGDKDNDKHPSGVQTILRFATLGLMIGNGLKDISTQIGEFPGSREDKNKNGNAFKDASGAPDLNALRDQLLADS